MANGKKKLKTTTIRDIALEAGVSIATVSKVINQGTKGMSEKTRLKILEIAQRLNYHPNLQARGLVSKHPESIGIIIPRDAQTVFTNPYFAEILKGIAETSRESRQYLVFSINGGEPYTQMYLERLAAGVIVLGHRLNDPQIEEAAKIKIPMVLIPGLLTENDIPSLDVDNVNGALQAVDHLAALGHRRISFLIGPATLKYHFERLSGYMQGLEKNGLPVNKDLVVEFNGTQEGGYLAMKKLLSTESHPTAVLVINDYSAMGAIQAAKELGSRIPQDVSVVGFGDVPFSSMITPGLTTVREPFHKLGNEAVVMLLRLIRGKRLSKKHMILPVELVVRGSTGAPPQDRKKGRPGKISQ